MRVQVDSTRALIYNLRYELEHLYVTPTRVSANVIEMMKDAEEAIRFVTSALEVLGQSEYPNGEIPDHT